MSSLMWYVYEFARKAWTDAFANAHSQPEISEKPDPEIHAAYKQRIAKLIK